MFKKISAFLLCLVLAACSTSRETKIAGRGGVQDFNTDISEINISGQDSFRVGMLLPLSGPAARHGQGLRNAAMVALEDINNPNLIVQFYDSKGTPEGARTAVKNAVAQKANIIVGPLMSTEVQAIANETIYQGIPVIAFSTAQEVLQPTVYTMGLLVEEQVDRIMTYAAQKGRSRFALLVPDNSTGNAVAKAAFKSAQKNNVAVTTIGYYQPSTSDFSGIIKEMTNYSERHGAVVRKKAELEAKAKAGDAAAAYELKKISTKEGIGELGFDAVLIPESGAKLTAAISMFAYYDAAYPDVQFLGTSVWETGKFNNESAMVKSWYPAISRAHSAYFAGKYNSVFGERPSSLYSFAYDAVALTNQLSRQPSERINQAITKPEGYIGINGAFRFFEDGTNQHSLDILEIRPTGNAVVDAAPKSFRSGGAHEKLPEPDVYSGFAAPKIYGKNQQAAEIAIFGGLLPAANDFSDEKAAEPTY
ncbi:MAG: penicillin-binding protein activator [Alphaproteobacteria bacterium]|nr:penicillin-binding protein activator [Alphaproteobacteria bacterium]